MNKFKEFFNQHKVTVMVIPNAKKSIKQWKFNLSIAFIILVGLIVVNLTLLINTVSSRAEAVTLSSENHELSESLVQTQDKINSLLSINSSSADEVEHLKTSLHNSSEFLKARLEEMEQAENYISQLVVMFNEETKSDLPVPVSRSYTRTLDVESELSEQIISEDQLLFDEIDALIVNDEIGTLINESSDTYSDLVTQLESQLTYLDSRPDFFPTKGKISSDFGFRRHPVTGQRSMHNGIDISNSSGTAIWAAGTGVVTFEGYDGNYGRVIIIDHGYGYETVYAHLSRISVEEGDTVQKGDQIGKMGATGRTTGPHLHFEIRYNGDSVDPLNILQ